MPSLPSKISYYDIRNELNDNGRTWVLHGYEAGFSGDVAIKLLPSDFFANPAFHARFDQDQKALALIDHQAIVPLIATDQTWEGRPYIVMRYMIGGSLADRLLGGPLSLEETYHILYDLASALDAAHAKGIIHGSLKPENVLFDENSDAYLSDFCMRPPADGRPGSLVNTLPTSAAYLSPEHLQGQALNAQSDIYALGALYYAMLTGRPPYTGDTPVMVAAQHLAASTPDLLAADPTLPPGCQDVLDIAMAKNPSQRFYSACEMVETLGQAMQGERIPLNADAGDSPVPEVAAIPVAPAPRRGIGAWVWAALLVGIIILGLIAGLILQPNLIQSVIALARNTTTSTAAPVSTVAASATFAPPSPLPSSLSSTAPTDLPTSTPRPPTPTRAAATTTVLLTPADTIAPKFTLTATERPIIGGADLIAFLQDNEIWIANLDGTGQERLTEDKIPKSGLRWTPDGQTLIYYADKCIYTLDLEARASERSGCFEDFAFSPDMKQMVLGASIRLSNRNMQWMNYFSPFSLDTVRTLGKIPESARSSNVCSFIGGRHTRFSTDGQTMAAVFSAPGLNGRNEDTIVVYKMGSCGDPLDRIDEFPGLRFSLRGYGGANDRPEIDEFGWDGEYLFALHGKVFQDYGDLVIYNMNRGLAETLNPINGQCCYKNMQWSPDGSYFLFVYQDASKGDGAKIYYIPYGSLGTGASYTPIELPFYFFKNIKALIEPALRPAR